MCVAGMQSGRSSWKWSGGSGVLGILTCAHLCTPQNIMPLSAPPCFERRKNPTPQCPPPAGMQMLMPVSWSPHAQPLPAGGGAAGRAAARLGRCGQERSP